MARDDHLLDSIDGERRAGPAWRRWLRERSTPARRAIAGTLFLGVAGLVWSFARRPDWAEYPALRMSIAVLGFLVLAALAIGAAVAGPEGGVTRRTRAAVLFAAFATPVVLAALPPARHAAPAPDLLRSAGACLVWGALVGLPLLGVLAAMDRARRLTRVAILLCIALAGLLGNLALQLHCPIVDPAHLLAGHALVPAALVLAMLPLLRS